MSVWRNEQDFMRDVDNMLSEFYIKDKKITPKKLNVQTQKQDKTWYESESDDEEKGENGNSKCPSMEELDTLQMMRSIRAQVRNVVGDRYSNDVLETYYKMDQVPSNKISEVAVPCVQRQVNESSNHTDTINKNLAQLSLNNHKNNVEEPVACSSKLNESSNVRSKFHTRGKKISNRAGSRGLPRYHNVAFSSLQSKDSFNYNSNSEFPPL